MRMTGGRRPEAARLRQLLALYLVTDAALAAPRPLADVVAAAVAGGVTCVQLREKSADAREIVALARALMVLLAPTGVPLVINDRIDIALACGAHGVHLGQRDIAPDDARRWLPAHVFIGWSVETMDDVARAHRLPVDYLGLSPVFATPTKTDTETPWGLDGVRAARAVTALPLVGIGGIHAANAAQVREAGADGVAVVSALCAAADPRAAARALLQPGSAPRC